MNKRSASEVIDVLDPTPEDRGSIQRSHFWKTAPHGVTSRVLDILSPTPEDRASIQRGISARSPACPLEMRP